MHTIHKRGGTYIVLKVNFGALLPQVDARHAVPAAQLEHLLPGVAHAVHLLSLLEVRDQVGSALPQLEASFIHPGGKVRAADDFRDWGVERVR
jgi:hypothetical protein